MNQFAFRLSANLVILAALFWGLAGCGGGSDATPATTQAAIAAPLPAPVVTTTPAVTAGGAAVATPVGAAQLEDFSCGLNGPPGIEAEVMQRINAIRAAGAVCGAKAFQPAIALVWNNTLLLAAKGHSTDMAQKNYFAHVGLDGRSASQRVTAAGYNWINVGENIAAGRQSVNEVMTAWANSPGHCQNLMNPEFRDVAVACVRNNAANYRMYWTMNLGRTR